MDGIDVALIRSDGEARVEPGPGATYPYPAEVARRAARRSSPIPSARAGRSPSSKRAVTDAHVAAVERFLAEFAIDRREVALVGLHGQTVLHRPRERFTRQLCDGARAAAQLGIDVVSDFRSADVAAGGEGAPLVPLYHAAMCAALDKPLMVLNWGGVGNVTYLGAAGEIVAFDTGPANALIDDFVARRLRREPRRGRAARRRRSRRRADRRDADARSLFRLARRPNRSTATISTRRARAVERLSDADGAATLAAFTIEATAAAARPSPCAPTRWLVCGGGRRNPTLMKGLAARLATRVEPIEAIGFDGDVVEAQCFAYLALRSRPACRSRCRPRPARRGR